mmetsp:Transcript_9267/g.16877  ORF Transcript_9267/g.16877 Transcript_9267/m.16877 type:complete len:254 (-) Transcript_9267:19-780(-)
MTQQNATNLILIPARFIVTIGHFLAISMANHSSDDNIRSSLYASSVSANDHYTSHYSTLDPVLQSPPTSLYHHPEYRSLRTELNSAISIAYACMAIDMISLLFGLSIFKKRVNFFQVVTHFFGSVLVCYFVGKSAMVGRALPFLNWHDDSHEEYGPNDNMINRSLFNEGGTALAHSRMDKYYDSLRRIDRVDSDVSFKQPSTLVRESGQGTCQLIPARSIEERYFSVIQQPRVEKRTSTGLDFVVIVLDRTEM